MQTKTKPEEKTVFLLVTEDGRFQKRACSILKDLHHKILIANQSFVARTTLMETTEKVDVIISDIDHTNAQGLTILAEAKKLRPGIKLFLVTAKKFESFVLEDAKKIGVTGTYLKRDIRALLRENGLGL